MTPKKTPKKSRGLADMPFSEALERFIRTDPRELNEALETYQRLKQEAKSLEKQVDEDQDRVTKRLRGGRGHAQKEGNS